MAKMQCLVCGEILHSKSRHDFQKCKCENQTFVDGGDDYVRAGGVDLSKIKFIADEDNLDSNDNFVLGDK